MTQTEYEARWTLWRWDRKEPFKEGGSLFLESKQWSVSGDTVAEEVPSFTLYCRFDECSHLHTTIVAPLVGRQDGGIGDYMHICGTSDFDAVIALLTEAKQIATHWFRDWQPEFWKP